MLDLNVGSVRGWIVCLMQQLRVNRCTDSNRLNDLLTFMSNAILKSGKKIFGMRKPSKFNVPGWNEREKELNAQYKEAVSHWNIAGRLRSGPLLSWNVGLSCPQAWNEFFSERIRINFVPNQCFQNFKGENAMISGRKLKHSTLRMNPCH